MAEPATWYVYDGKDKSGPLPAAQAVALALAGPNGRRTLMWTQGMSGWTALEQVPALAPHLAPGGAPPSPSKPWRAPDKTGDHSMMIEVAKMRDEATGMIEAPSVLKEATDEARLAARAERAARARRSRSGRLMAVLLLLAGAAALLLYMYGSSAHAAEPPPPAAPGSPAEKINVDKFKEKFWAKGEESELRVVQNRLYSKQHKIHIGLLGGSVSTDPFLRVFNYGGQLGYHINEYFGINAVAWAYSAGPSSALQTLQEDKNITANTNLPKYFYGGELTFSPVYGKLSLLGKAIIYLDTHLMAGAGMLSTETGSYISPILGIGEQVFLNKYLSLSLEYRFMYTSEKAIQKEAGPTQGQLIGPRGNAASVITLGASFMFGLF